MPQIPLSQDARERRKRFLSVAEAAHLLGVSHSTLHRAVVAGDFPAIKVRGRYVVPAKAIDDMESAALTHGLVDTADFLLPGQSPRGEPDNGPGKPAW